MKKINIILFLLLVISAQAYSQSGWFVQKSSFSPSPKKVFFLNENYGWVLLDSARIVRTTNGGLNWSAVYSMQSNYPAYDVKFINPMTGWAVGGDIVGTPLYEYYCMILKTTNGGINWVQQFSDSWGPCFNTIAIADSLNVFVSASGTNMTGFGSTGKLMKTSNGGLNWTSDAAISGLATNCVFFINSNTGWVNYYVVFDVPPAVRIIQKTTNKGATWNLVLKDSVNNFMVRSNLFFKNENIGYCKDLNYLYRTSNGGVNWTRSDTSTYLFTDLFFVNNDTGWIAKSGLIRRTNNGGLNWFTQSAPASATKLFFINQNTGWALGNSLMKTTNGGLPESNFAEYFPLQVGNRYLYHWYSSGSSNNGEYWASITKDTIAHGHRYFYLSNFPYIGNKWVRFDTATNCLVYYSENINCGGYINDAVIDSLSLQIGDTSHSCDFSYIKGVCINSYNRALFSTIVTQAKTIRHDYLLIATPEYGRNFGLIELTVAEPPPYSTATILKGCVINGVVYGDTNMTGVKNEGTEMPSVYSLKQNYPNPFNPVTNIKFEIPKTSYVRISVYDISGREIDVPVNEQLQAGAYSITWNGALHSSGIYFYRMKADGFSDTKRMILIK